MKRKVKKAKAPQSWKPLRPSCECGFAAASPRGLAIHKGHKHGRTWQGGMEPWPGEEIPTFESPYFNEGSPEVEQPEPVAKRGWGSRLRAWSRSFFECGEHTIS